MSENAGVVLNHSKSGGGSATIFFCNKKDQQKAIDFLVGEGAEVDSKVRKFKFKVPQNHLEGIDVYQLNVRNISEEAHQFIDQLKFIDSESLAAKVAYSRIGL